MKKACKSFIVLLLVILVSFTITSCSDVKNREEPESQQEPQGLVSIEVKSRSTTTGSESVDSLDKDVEELITKSLSQIFIAGYEKKALFSEETQELATETFKNFKESKDNKVEVEFNYFNNDSEPEKLVVVTFDQKVTLGKSEKSVSGKIYFDSKGKVIGFDVPKASQNAGVEQ